MPAILNFRIFFKNAKHKSACISKTMLDRAILVKFLTHRESLLSTRPSFQIFFVRPKLVAILNFRSFHKNCKTQNCIWKTMSDRANLAKFLTHRVSVKTSLSKFQQIFHLPKMAAILNFRVFSKMLVSRKPC